MTATRSRILPLCLVLGLLVPCVLGFPAEAVAGTEGVLKQKVQLCVGTFWVSDGQVDVSIQRTGSGEVDSATGWTDGSGYVEFTFSDLERGDQAHVTITPVDQDPDTGHIYYWVPPELRGIGYWDLGIMSEDLCNDSYYDEENNIILAVYKE